MKTPLLIFKSRALEDQFKKSMTGEKEIGGWLFTSSWREEIADWKATRALFDTFALTISAWMILPNESPKPEREWSSSHFDIAKEIAEKSASSMNCSALFFHTHSTGWTNEPSQTDLKFTVNCCPIWNGTGESVIVQTSPLRVNYYRVEKSRVKGGHNWLVAKGEFLSWRSPRMKRIVAGD